ncbi:hypothetical protein [Spirosoma pomorum]
MATFKMETLRPWKTTIEAMAVNAASWHINGGFQLRTDIDSLAEFATVLHQAAIDEYYAMYGEKPEPKDLVITYQFERDKPNPGEVTEQVIIQPDDPLAIITSW